MLFFVCVFSHTSTRFCFIFQAVYLRFQGIWGEGVLPYMGYIGTCRCERYGYQAVYYGIGCINQRVWAKKRTLLRVLVYLSTQMWKSGFFLSRSHIGRDSGFSSKIGRIPTRSGWLNILNWWLQFKRTKTTSEVKVTLPFSCLMFKFSFDHLQLLQFICYFELEIRKNKISLPLKALGIG